MGRLWAQPRVTFDGRYRMFNGPGINPPAAIGCTSICFGSHADVILDASRPLGQRQKPLAKFGRLRSFTKEKPATIRPRETLRLSLRPSRKAEAECCGLACGTAGAKHADFPNRGRMASPALHVAPVPLDFAGTAPVAIDSAPVNRRPTRRRGGARLRKCAQGYPAAGYRVLPGAGAVAGPPQRRSTFSSDRDARKSVTMSTSVRQGKRAAADAE